MANVNNRDFVAADSIIDNVRIATEPKGMDAQLRDHTVSNLQVAEFRNPFLDKCFDVPRSAGCAD